MRYKFKLGGYEYIHLVSSLIREEIGKTFKRIRIEQNLSIEEAFKKYYFHFNQLPKIENNLSRTPWGEIKKAIQKYGYEIIVDLKCSADIQLNKLPEKKKHKHKE